MSCGVGRRCSLDPDLLWLWCRLVATASIQPLAWEPPCATGAALEKAKRQKKKKESEIPWAASRALSIAPAFDYIKERLEAHVDKADPLSDLTSRAKSEPPTGYQEVPTVS